MVHIAYPYLSTRNSFGVQLILILDSSLLPYNEKVMWSFGEFEINPFHAHPTMRPSHGLVVILTFRNMKVYCETKIILNVRVRIENRIKPEDINSFFW